MQRGKSGAGRRSISRTQWASFAEELKRNLSGVAYGNRLAKYGELADKHGLDVNVIRRAVRALSALDEIAGIDGDLAHRLRHAPLAVAEVVARWLKHDELAAVAAGRLFLAGKFTTLSLTEAEKKSRPASETKKTAVSEWRHIVQQRAQALLGSGYILESEIIDGSQVPPLWSVTYKKLKNHSKDKIIVFGPGPWRDIINYKRQMAYIVYSAAGLFLHEGITRSYIFLPSKKLSIEYETFFKKSPVLDCDIHFVPIAE
jgi:hypothetical protein